MSCICHQVDVLFIFKEKVVDLVFVSLEQKYLKAKTQKRHKRGCPLLLIVAGLKNMADFRLPEGFMYESGRPFGYQIQIQTVLRI